MDSGKKTFLYVMIAILAVVVIFLIGNNSLSKRNEEEQAEKIENVNKSDFDVMEQKIISLQKENDTLKQQLEDIQYLESKVTNATQAISSMKDVHNMYKEGRQEEALEKFKMISTAGFDDMALDYYKLLRDYITK